MQFDWKDLVLWCTCTFYLGMCVGPVFFLDAEILKWGSICGAALAATLAIGGFLLNSSSHRLQTQLADRAEFQKVWNMLNRGQLVRSDLLNAADQIRMLIDQYEAGEDLTRRQLIFLEFNGANVGIEDHPYVYRLVDTIWRGLRSYGDGGRNVDEQNILITDEEIQNLRERVDHIEEVRELVKTNFLDLVLPYFESRGWKFDMNDRGQYVTIKQGR